MSFRRLREPTYVCVLADELSFWFTNETYANPDTEVLAAVRPALLTTRGPLFMASSPYARKGVLWDTYRKHYGPTGDPLILWWRRAPRATLTLHFRKPRSIVPATRRNIWPSSGVTLRA